MKLQEQQCFKLAANQTDYMFFSLFCCGLFSWVGGVTPKEILAPLESLAFKMCTTHDEYSCTIN